MQLDFSGWSTVDVLGNIVLEENIDRRLTVWMSVRGYTVQLRVCNMRLSLNVSVFNQCTLTHAN